MYSRRADGPSRIDFKRTLKERKGQLFPPKQPSRRKRLLYRDQGEREYNRRLEASRNYAHPIFGGEHGGPARQRFLEELRRYEQGEIPGGNVTGPYEGESYDEVTLERPLNRNTNP